MPLTDVKCRNAKAQNNPCKLSDGGGLHLLVNSDGAKYWRLAYRWHGKQRTPALGVYPAVGLMEVRAAREDAKRSLAANIDPSIVKRERKRAAKIAIGNSFETIAREWHDNWKDARSPYYAEQILRRLKADVFPEIGRRPIAEIEPDAAAGEQRNVVTEIDKFLREVRHYSFGSAVEPGRNAFPLAAQFEQFSCPVRFGNVSHQFPDPLSLPYGATDPIERFASLLRST